MASRLETFAGVFLLQSLKSFMSTCFSSSHFTGILCGADLRNSDRSKNSLFSCTRGFFTTVGSQNVQCARLAEALAELKGFSMCFPPNHLQFVIKLPSNYIALFLMLNSVEVARKLRATCSVQDSNGFPKAAAATTKDFCVTYVSDPVQNCVQHVKSKILMSFQRLLQLPLRTFAWLMWVTQFKACSFLQRQRSLMNTGSWDGKQTGDICWCFSPAVLEVLHVNMF